MFFTFDPCKRTRCLERCRGAQNNDVVSLRLGMIRTSRDMEKRDLIEPEERPSYSLVTINCNHHVSKPVHFIRAPSPALRARPMAVHPRLKPFTLRIFPAALRLLAVACRFKILECTGPTLRFGPSDSGCGRRPSLVTHRRGMVPGRRPNGDLK
jgi:hypothetical protein